MILGMVMSLASPSVNVNVNDNIDMDYIMERRESLYNEMASFGSYEDEDAGKQAASHAFAFFEVVHPGDTLEAVKEYRRTLNTYYDCEPSVETLYAVGYLFEVEYKSLLNGGN